MLTLWLGQNRAPQAQILQKITLRSDLPRKLKELSLRKDVVWNVVVGTKYGNGRALIIKMPINI